MDLTLPTSLSINTSQMESLESPKSGMRGYQNRYRHRKLKSDSVDAITADAKTWSQPGNEQLVSIGTRDEDGEGDSNTVNSGIIMNALHDRDQGKEHRHQKITDVTERGSV